MTWRLVPWALLIVAAALALLASDRDENPELGQLRANLRAANQANAKLKVENAQLWAHKTKPRIDTVRVLVNRYRTVRDTIQLSDATDSTLAAAADSLAEQCFSLATACETQRERDAALIASQQSEIAGWKRLHENAMHPRCGRKCGFVLGVASALAAAFVANQLNRAATP